MFRKYIFRKYPALSLLVSALLALMAVSCGGAPDNTAAGTGAPSSSAAVSTAAPSPAPEAASTAKPQDTPAPAAATAFKLPAKGMRPIAVMIDNEGTRSLPQGGLEKAQVVYEILAEGGETRLMPVFWDEDPRMIGPVRSSRDYFLDYAMENDAIYVHFGWSPKAQQDIKNLRINNINGVANGGEIFWDLTKDRGNWQDSYTSMKNILAYVSKVKYRTSTDRDLVFSYNDSCMEPAGGQKADKVSVSYSTSSFSSYEYDPASKSYLRFRKGKPHMERESGQQLRAVNIIIEYTHNATIKGDKAGRQTVTTTGRGKGYYITCGKAIPITWSKESRSAPTRYTDGNGAEIKLNPGQTWVQIFPATGRLKIE